MLNLYIGECLVSIININNDIKEPIQRYQGCDTTLIILISEGGLTVSAGH